MLRVLGLPQRTMAWAYHAGVCLAVGLCWPAVCGVGLGYGVHHVFVLLLGSLLSVALPAASFWPVLFGLGLGLTLMAAFGLPPVLQLAQCAARCASFRRDVGGIKPASLGVLAPGGGRVLLCCCWLSAATSRWACWQWAALPLLCWCLRWPAMLRCRLAAAWPW
jgi:putative ABC transport system permease protein